MGSALKKDNIINLQDSTKIKKGPTKKKGFFYKVENHSELFKLGSSFLQDYNKGLKSFAIGSTGYQNSQQKTILGLASFFDHYSDYRIAIISDNLFNSTFNSVISESTESELHFGNNFEKIKIFNFHDHFDFIDLNILLDVGSSHLQESVEQKVEEVMNYYDIVFWDIPELEKIKEEPESYYLMIRSFDSLSIVVSSTNCSESDLENIKSFFQSYSINIKGLLFDSTINEKKAPWWKRIIK